MNIFCDIRISERGLFIPSSKVCYDKQSSAVKDKVCIEQCTKCDLIIFALSILHWKDHNKKTTAINF